MERAPPKRGLLVSRPVSRILSCAAIYLCAPPGSRRAGSSILLGLAPDGVWPAAASPRRWCALTAPFHPCLYAPHLVGARHRRSVSVPLSRGFPRVGVTDRPCPSVSGLSSRVTSRDCVACATDSTGRIKARRPIRRRRRWPASAPAPPASARRAGSVIRSLSFGVDDDVGCSESVHGAGDARPIDSHRSGGFRNVYRRIQHRESAHHPPLVRGRAVQMARIKPAESRRALSRASSQLSSDAEPRAGVASRTVVREHHGALRVPAARTRSSGRGALPTLRPGGLESTRDIRAGLIEWQRRRRPFGTAWSSSGRFGSAKSCSITPGAEPANA